MEEVLINSNIKGKRTKRQRPQSPIPFHNDDTNASQRACAAEDFLNNSTEEEEDMANCLILLAQCESPKQDHDHYNHNIKFNSKRFLEPPSTGTGSKRGYYVYECKTCNRTFPSFQALGGHRASHKKPKAMSQQQQQRPFLVSDSDEEDGNFRNVSSLSLQLSDNNNNNRGSDSNLYNSSSMKSNRIHECSICRAEFTSGQALGGHMRRHRAVAVATTTNTTLSLSPVAVGEVDKEPRKSRNNILFLDLDLNLPAPEDDLILRESKLPFSSSNQQKASTVFSAAPTLVDCQYY